MQRVTGVVLAGGRSTRMGLDKLLVVIGGVTLIERVVAPLKGACEEVLVVGATSAPLPPGTRPVPDLRSDRAGPLAGIEAGLAAARNPSVFVAAADMPFLTEAVVTGLSVRLGGDVRVAVPRHNGRRHPLCASYDRELLPTIRALLDDGERAVVRALGVCEGVEYVDEEELRRLGDPDLFLMNVNSPEDLARAERRERGC